MKPYRPNRGATPEENLTAFVDGELEAPERREVEAWLAQHPEAAAEVDAQRQLAQLCRATQPASPSEAAWVEVLEKIDTALSTAPAPAPETRPAARTRTRSLWVGWLLRLTAAAAAVWLLVILEPFPWPGPAPGDRAEPFPVASAEDVDIVSMNPDDAGTLVVGEPPLRDPLDLATGEEVVIHSVQPDVDGMVPQVWGQGETAAVPMIVAPVVAAQANFRRKP